jgi:hypothetical protein
MVFQFNDVNCSVRIITSIYRAHIQKNCLFINESGLREGSEQTNVLFYESDQEAKKDLKKLVKMMNKYYEKQHDMIDKQPAGFVHAQGEEIYMDDETDYYEED